MTNSADEDLIIFSNVKKSYDGESYVVRGLNLNIRRGEFLTLLGPSGSGKTTTLMMLAGFETPTSGQIVFEGRQIDSLPPHKRGIGVVFQNYALFPHMSIANNVAFPLRMRGLPRQEIEARVLKALDMIRMKDFAQRMPGQISGGQQQRIALARALVFEPKLVLMDEPLGALDKQLREHMQLEIRHLHADLGITVVYVTHDQSEALTMSDRVGVFNDGVMQQVATPATLYEEPANLFVAQFIGENNAITGVVRSLTPQRCTLETADGTLIHALPGEALVLGGAAALALRPERLRLVGGVNDPEFENTCPATVQELIYHGGHVRLRAKACGHEDILVNIPNTGNISGMHKGDEIVLGWRCEDSRALVASS
ncbi:ABC transporter ATP-binding protein [Alcaligenaceae bacterium CGII-47]|nr:ABC transporter ATP-binding protein [Alcaligenaceae bacterium CGII-47]